MVGCTEERGIHGFWWMDTTLPAGPTPSGRRSPSLTGVGKSVILGHLDLQQWGRRVGIAKGNCPFPPVSHHCAALVVWGKGEKMLRIQVWAVGAC